MRNWDGRNSAEPLRRLALRLPERRGVLSIEAQNLLDQDFGFQDRRPSRDIFATPRYAPDLTVVAKATIRF